MKISEIMDTFGITLDDVKDLEIDPVLAVTNKEWNRPRRGLAGQSQEDYRDRVVNRLMTNRVGFDADNNTFRTDASRCVNFAGPAGGALIVGQGDGGAICGVIQGASLKGHCKQCAITVSLTMPPNGLSVRFHDLPENKE